MTLKLRIILLNMKKPLAIISFCFMTAYLLSCGHPGDQGTTSYLSATDPELGGFISNIRAVDNHAHPNTIEPDDKGSDALPLDGLGAIELPARVRPESQTWLDASKALYGFAGAELN